MSPTPSPSSRSQFLDFGLREGPAVPSTAVEKKNQKMKGGSQKMTLHRLINISCIDVFFYLELTKHFMMEELMVGNELPAKTHFTP